MKALKITGLTLLILVAAVLLFAAFVLPGIVRSQAVSKVEEMTGRKLSIRDVSINPLSLTVKVSGVDYKEADGKTTFVSFSSATVSASVSSLWRMAPILDRAKLQAPYVHVVRLDANRYNFSDIQERLAKLPKKPEEKEKKAEFSVNNISLTNGSVDFLDVAVNPDTPHTVRSMNIEIPFISNMAYLAEKYVNPSFAALVNGSPVAVEGQLKPFKESVEASVAVNLKDADIPYYHAYIPAESPVKIESGKVTIDGQIVYIAHKNAKPDLLIRGFLGLKEVLLKDRMKEPIFALKKGTLQSRELNIMANKYEVDALDTDGMEVWLARDKRGVWSHTRLAAAKKPGPEQPKKQEKEKQEKVAKTPVVRVNTAAFRNGLVHYNDDQYGFRDELQNIALQVGGFNLQNENTAVTLSLNTATGERLQVAGLLSLLDPVNVGVNVRLTGIGLQTYYPYVKEFLARPVKGTAEVAGNIFWDPKTGVQLDGVGLSVRNLAADFGGGDHARLGVFSVSDVKFNQRENNLSINTVLFDRGNFRVTRAQDGKLSAMNILRVQKKGSSVQKPTKKSKTPVLRYRIDDTALKRLNLTFKDQSTGETVTFRLRNTDADVKNLTGPKFRPIPFRIDTGYAESGFIHADGTVVPDPLKARINGRVRNIPLKDFQPYLPKNVQLIVADGKLNTSLHASVARKGDKTTGDFSGDVSVRSFQAKDPVKKADLLVWESLDVRKMKGQIEPFSLSIDEVALNEYYANILIGEDGTVNLKQVVKTEEKPKEEPKKEGPPPDIKVRTITLTQGVMAFEDRHLQPQPYSAKFVKLGGRISGITSEPGKVAEIDLRGSLEDHSPLRISGGINPLADPFYLNLKIDFEDIELPRLTPYSGTYLGYAINQGKLHMDLRYRVEGKELKAENKVLIDQLTFGREIDSDEATNLPVPLAVSLMKDRKGEINLDIPVSGRTDDPNFSIWKTVRQVLENLIIKVTTTPFTTLFKEKGDWGNVYFTYGKWAVLQQETTKLKRIGEVLAERQEVKIDAIGFVDRERDMEPYRQQLMLDKLRMQKFISTLKSAKDAPQVGQIPENIRIEAGEYGKWLKKAYEAADFPKPRTSSGQLRELPEEEMKKLLLAHTPVGDAEFRELARLRSLAVRDYLAKTAGIDQSRMFLKMGDIYKAPEAGAASAARVEITLPPVKKTKEKK